MKYYAILKTWREDLVVYKLEFKKGIKRKEKDLIYLVKEKRLKWKEGYFRKVEMIMVKRKKEKKKKKEMKLRCYGKWERRRLWRRKGEPD